MTQQDSIGSVNQGGLSGWWRVYLQHRYAVLFYSLILTLVVAPVLRMLGMPGTFTQLFLGLNLLAAVVQFDSRKRHWVLPAILLGAVFLRIWTLQAGHEGFATLSLFLWTAIGLYAVFLALRFALGSSIITSEHLYAALSSYLLAGVFMGVLYWSLNQVWSDSIIVNGRETSQPFLLGEGIYFSFITLATVGYGDMVPGNPVVRNLAITEAIAGQFYLAVMIARLMSLYISKPR